VTDQPYAETTAGNEFAFAFGIGRVDYVFGRAQDYSNIMRHGLIRLSRKFEIWETLQRSFGTDRKANKGNIAGVRN